MAPKPLKSILLTALALAATLLPARAAEVWIGGSRAWPDFIAPATTDQWTFLQNNADGFYINDFALRLTDKTLKMAPTMEGREAQLRAMNDLMKSDKLFYETDIIHATDEFDRMSLQAFARQGFDVTAATINRGTTPTRSAILTDNGKIPLYYMFGPWRGGGDINNAENTELRANIASSAGGAVSDWLDLAPVLRATDGGNSLHNYDVKWRLGERDVTAQIMGDGLVFSRDLRLNPGDKRELTLQINRKPKLEKRKVAPLSMSVELLPHPSTPVVAQTLKLSAGDYAR